VYAADAAAAAAAIDGQLLNWFASVNTQPLPTLHSMDKGSCFDSGMS